MLFYKKVHLKFKLNNCTHTFEDLKEVAYNFIKEGLPFEQAIGEFLLDWLDDNDFIEVKTSGSTGKPKLIRIKKLAMVNSAFATGDFLNLKPGDKALYCLPSDYVAGKMMLVRAIILGLELDLTQPTSQPIFDYEKHYDFAAMVPMQLEKVFGYCNNIKTIIVGGTAVSNRLNTAVQNVKSNIYETYGMTETVTHIALKKLNNFESLQEGTTKQFVKPHFKVLPNVKISQDDRHCLIIKAPKLSEETIVTNDIVKLYSETEFEWLGRYDNVINSGGIKLFPEQIEVKLQNKINSRFFIASIPHEILSEQVVLVVESDSSYLDNSVFNNLDKYEIPKHIYNVSQFIETSSGKVQRKKTFEIVLKG